MREVMGLYTSKMRDKEVQAEVEAPKKSASKLKAEMEAMGIVTESARACSYYSVSTHCNSNFTLLAVQIWLYQCI